LGKEKINKARRREERIDRVTVEERGERICRARRKGREDVQG
jgi:hypothetical protein